MCYWSSHISPVESWTVTLRSSTDQATYNSSNRAECKWYKTETLTPPTWVHIYICLFVLLYTLINLNMTIKRVYSTRTQNHSRWGFALGNTPNARLMCCRYQHVGIKKICTPNANPCTPNAKGLVINYGEGGATKWENRRSETFCTTPSRQGKTFRAPPFKEWKPYAHPLQYG